MKSFVLLGEVAAVSQTMFMRNNQGYNFTLPFTAHRGTNKLGINRMGIFGEQR